MKVKSNVIFMFQHFTLITIVFLVQVAIIVLALASVVAANRYAKPSYGHGQSNYGHSAATYQTDYVVSYLLSSSSLTCTFN